MKRNERRAQVLRVAGEVFAAKGYHAAKIDDIVEQAHIARGTFYLYFKDKRHVFGELLEQLLAQLRIAVQRVDLNGTPVEQQLWDNLHRVITLLFAERALTKILVSEAVGLDPGFDEKLLAFYDQVSLVIEGSLAEGERLSLVRPSNHQVAACSIVGSVKEVVYRAIFGRNTLSVDEVVAALYDYHARAVLRPDSVALLAKTG